MTSKIIYNKRKTCVYFDFETTYDDMYASIKNKGVKQKPGLQSFEQIEFALSIVCNIKIKFRDII